jgi:two-component system nitrogen regulation sensor histidine kinase GlnL
MEIESRDLEVTRVSSTADRLQTRTGCCPAPAAARRGDVNIHEVCERALLILPSFRGLTVARVRHPIPEFRAIASSSSRPCSTAHKCQALSDRIAAGDAKLVFRTRLPGDCVQRYRLHERYVIDNRRVV